VLQDYEKNPEQVDFRDPAYVKKTSDRMPDIGRKVKIIPLMCKPAAASSFWETLSVLKFTSCAMSPV